MQQNASCSDKTESGKEALRKRVTAFAMTGKADFGLIVALAPSPPIKIGISASASGTYMSFKPPEQGIWRERHWYLVASIFLALPLLKELVFVGRFYPGRKVH